MTFSSDRLCIARGVHRSAWPQISDLQVLQNVTLKAFDILTFQRISASARTPGMYEMRETRNADADRPIDRRPSTVKSILLPSLRTLSLARIILPVRPEARRSPQTLHIGWFYLIAALPAPFP